MLNKYLDEYIEYLNINNYSINTINSYKNCSKSFSSYFNNYDINDITYEHIEKYLINLNISNRSINLHISFIKNFYKYIHGMYRINNIVINIKRFKEDNKIYRSVSKDYINLINQLSIKEQLIIRLLLECGLRVSELINIKIKDINISNNSIKVIGKGNKERIIPVYKELMLFIISTISNNSTYLIVDSNNKKMNRNQIYYIIKKRLNTNPHNLRHYYASNLANNGMKIEILSNLLGHSNISTTQIYTHIDYNAIKLEYDRIFNN